MEIRAATRQEIEQAQAGGTPLLLVRLGLDMTSAITAETMHENFMATLARGYTPINGLLGKCSGACSIVGAGPSLADTWKDLKGDVLAINSAVGALLERGVTPKFAMLWDGLEIVKNFVKQAPEVTWLVASRCHPEVFKALNGSKVIVWHAGGDHNIIEVLQRKETEERQKELGEPYPVLLNGGSAGITRGIFVATALGYKDIHIFGGDSSYGEAGDTHINGSLVAEKDVMIAIGNEKPLWFRTTPEWCAQVEEYRAIFGMMVMYEHKAMTLEVHGRGMLRAMHELLTAKLEKVGREKFIEDIGAQEEERMALAKAASELPEGAPNVLKPQMIPPTAQPLEERP